MRFLISIVIIAIFAVLFFYPKPCDRVLFSDPDNKNCDCVCFGVKKNNGSLCYGAPVAYQCIE